MQNESNLLLVSITVCMWSNPNLFRRTVLQKCGKDINCSLDYGSWVKNFNIPQSKPKQAAVWQIFSSTKSVPANRKTGFYANRDAQVGSWIHFCTKRLRPWSLFKYSRVKLTNQKPIVVDVLFKAYPMVTVSYRFNLAGQCLLVLPFMTKFLLE